MFIMSRWSNSSTKGIKLWQFNAVHTCDDMFGCNILIKTQCVWTFRSVQQIYANMPHAPQKMKRSLVIKIVTEMTLRSFVIWTPQLLSRHRHFCFATLPGTQKTLWLRSESSATCGSVSRSQSTSWKCGWRFSRRRTFGWCWSTQLLGRWWLLMFYQLGVIQWKRDG